MTAFSTIATLAAVAVASAAAQCESGWRYLGATHSCYTLIDQALPWSVSEIRCLYQGGHHVSIGSYEENQFVHELARHQEAWTGAAFFGSDYRYVNSDHTPFGVFEGWQAGGVRPSMNRARRCVKMDDRGEWFQSCCKKLAVTICKKPSYADSNSVFH